MMIRMSLILTLAVFLLACGSTDNDNAGTENATTENAAADPITGTVDDESTDQNKAAQEQWEEMVEESEQADDGT